MPPRTPPPLPGQKKSGEKDKDSLDDLGGNATEELRKQGYYYICGEIDEGDLVEVHADILLKHLSPRWKDDVTLIINSCGGSVAETWFLIDLLDYVRMDVRTIGLGICMSSGAHLLAAGTPGKRLVAPNTSIMTHNAWIGHAEGDVHQLEAATKDLQDELDRDIRFWLARSSLTTRNQVEKELLRRADRYLNAEEVIKYGIADGVIGREVSKTTPKAVRTSIKKK